MLKHSRSPAAQQSPVSQSFGVKLLLMCPAVSDEPTGREAVAKGE
jgi:hypothetical protein